MMTSLFLKRRKCERLIVAAVLLVFTGGSRSENFEFQVTNPILLSSLRSFLPTSELYVSKARNGSIVLRADEGYGIMAVIQKMNLQDLNSEFRSSSCFDYLTISELNGTGSTGEICGNSEATSFVQPSFVDKSGQTKLNYVLHEKVRLSAFDGNYTNFNISFTPFRECPEDAFPFGNEHWRPCSTIDSFSCIPIQYFCDGVVNCGFPDEFGLDEIFCAKEGKLNSRRNRTKSTSKPKDELTYFKDGSEKKPFHPYIPDHSPFDLNQSSTPYPFIIFTETRRSQAPLGLLALVVICLALVARRRSRRLSSEEACRAKTLEAHKSPTVIHLIRTEYDEEADPAPSYEDSLFLPSVTTILEIESEAPPSYRDIQVHKSKG